MRPEHGLRALLAPLLAALLGACAVTGGPFTGGDGLGGTGKLAGGDGLGGTGKLAGGDGLGGTGKLAGGDGLGGTGIVGAITGFGSIEVNGLRVAVTDATTLSADGRAAREAQLRVGEVAEILADGPRSALQAREIRVDRVLRGPLAVAGEGVFEVLGQAVRVDASTVLGPEVELAAGRWVAVSGLAHPDGHWLATRVDSVPAGGRAILAGRVEALAGRSLRIGSQPVLAANGTGSGLANGRHAWVAGSLRGGTLVADALRVRPRLPFAGRARRLVLQGFLERADGSGALRVADWHLPVQARVPAAASDAAVPLLIEASLSARGDYRVERVLRAPAPDRPVPAPGDAAPPGPAPAPEGASDRPPAPERAPDRSAPPPPAAVRPVSPARPDVPERPQRPEPVPIQDAPLRPDPVPDRESLPEPAPVPDLAPVPEIEPPPDLQPVPDRDAAPQRPSDRLNPR